MPAPRRRRTVAPVLVVLAVLAGCSTGTDAPAGTTGPPRTVVHERGPVEIPAAPASVVALDEYAAINLLAVGIRPTTVFGGLSSQVATDVLRAGGVEVVPAPTMITTPDVEAIAAVRPDVVVLTSSGGLLDTTYPQLSAVAPTLVLPFEGAWQAPVELAGDAFGVQDRAARVITVLQDRLTDLRARTAAGSPRVSVLASFQGLLYSPAPANPGSALVAGAGFARPPAQTVAASGASASTIPLSAESLADHDADAVVVYGGSIYDSAAVTSLPTFGRLAAAREGRSAVALGEMWAGGTPLATWWVLDDLDALADGRYRLGGAADGPARAAALDAATGGGS